MLYALLMPWGTVIQTCGIIAAIGLFIRIGHDLYVEHRARQSNS